MNKGMGISCLSTGRYNMIKSIILTSIYENEPFDLSKQSNVKMYIKKKRPKTKMSTLKKKKWKFHILSSINYQGLL